MSTKQTAKISTSSLQEIASNLSAKLSDAHISIAHIFIETGNLLKSIKTVLPKKSSSNHSTIKGRLLRSSQFLQYVHFLRECAKNEVFIDKNIILKKLQTEFLGSSGKESAELAKVLNAMQGYSIDRKEITIRIPDALQAQLSGNPERPKIDQTDPKKSIEQSKREFQELILQAQDADFIEVE